VSGFAAKTGVSVAKSREEIESLLTRYGASSFASGWSGTRSVIQFDFKGRRIRIALELPAQNERRFTHTPGRGNLRTPEDARAEWEQGCRARWRALALVVKAKLEAVESGIATFEQEFLSYVVLPNGQTAGEVLIPQIASAYENGRMPPLLPGATES
jgi:hypothetical protein